MSDCEKKTRADNLITCLAFTAMMFIIFLAGALDNHFRISPIHNWLAESDLAYASLDLIKKEKKNKQTKPKMKAKEYYTKVSINLPESYKGYTLYPHSRGASLVDNSGVVVYKWPTNASTNKTEKNFRKVSIDARVLPNGELIVVYQLLGITPYASEIAKFDKKANLIWSFGEEKTHHTFSVASDGSIYALIQKLDTTSDFKGIEDTSVKFLNEGIIHLSNDGALYDKFYLMQAFLDSKYRDLIVSGLKRKNDKKDKQGQESWDPIHVNSVVPLEHDIAKMFPMFKPGQLLISLRSRSVIAVVDMESKKIVWATKGPWRVQHDATFSKDGTIMIFDNQGKSNHESRILKFNPALGTTSVVYEGNADHPFFSSVRGNKQVLPNNNLLINESIGGRIFEINPQGEIVWQFESSRAIKAAYRYSAEELPFLNKQ